MEHNIYQQIIIDIEGDISAQHYKPGNKLPSVRDLSKKYQCSKNTVIKALEILKNRHIIYSVPQSGYYIVENLLRNETGDSPVIDFSTGNPTIGTIHSPDLKHCLDRAVDIYNNTSLDHGPYGVDSLRNILPGYLADSQVFTTVDNIFINQGIQQMLSILTQMPFPNGNDGILIEQPTYRYFTDFLKSCGVRVVGIPRNESGIDLNQLETIFKTAKIKFFYTISRNHNPLGTSYPKAQRKAIAALAAKYNVYIVEDDYFGDIVFDPRVDPIYADGDHFHHIYLKNYSKIIPWIRIGLAVVPTHLLAVFKQHVAYSYYDSYFSPSLVSQATLEIYIRSNLLKKHTTAIKKELQERLQCLKACCGQFQQYGIQFCGGAGFCSFLKLPETVAEERLVETLKQKQVLVTAGRPFYFDNSCYQSGIRISIAHTDRQSIERGLAIIRTEIATAMSK
jgi:DNA-binding transcriptional MocR family regulator